MLLGSTSSSNHVAISRVVGGDLCERVARQATFRLLADLAVGAQFVEHHGVVGRVDDDCYELVVLCCSPHHGRATDIDQLDAGVGGEGVEVADQQVDWLDAVLGHVGLVFSLRRIRQQTAVNRGMKGDDSMVEDGRVHR